MATRHINLANALGVGNLGGGIGPKIGPSLSTPDSMVEDCASMLGWKDTLAT